MCQVFVLYMCITHIYGYIYIYMGVHQYNYTYIYIYYVYIYITSAIIIVYVHDMWVLHMGFKLSSGVLFVDLWLRLWEKKQQAFDQKSRPWVNQGPFCYWNGFKEPRWSYTIGCSSPPKKLQNIAIIPTCCHPYWLVEKRDSQRMGP